MKKILIFTDHYIPSVKGGGPIQSIKNLVDSLSSEIDFYIVTSDRDIGDDKQFKNITINKWVQVGNAKVYYTNSSKLKFKDIRDLINFENYDVIYLNSFFSYKFSIIPIFLKKIRLINKKIPIVIAPRGQFSPGALEQKNRKKNLFIKLVKMIGLYRNVRWHATAKAEKTDIIDIIDAKNNIIVANNLTPDYKELKYEKKEKKKSGELKIVFLSRIHPKKNLIKAIEFLNNVKGEIEFSIYGPIENQTYWSECKKKIKALPKNIKVSYNKTVKHDQVINIFKKHHIFLFPTLGENYGHVISEALISGCPIIISDQTPWRELNEKKVGWDINLKNEEKFITTIQKCIDMDNQKYTVLSKNAFNYGKKKSKNQEDLLDYIELFEFNDSINDEK